MQRNTQTIFKKENRLLKEHSEFNETRIHNVFRGYLCMCVCVCAKQISLASWVINPFTVPRGHLCYDSLFKFQLCVK